MRALTLARGSALAGLAAASATVAHGGAAALTDPAWALPALAGSAAGAAALLRLASASASARRTARAVRAGRRPGRPPVLGGRAPGLPETAAVMLAAQGCAHLALLAAGADAHTGATGSIALHVGLALIGAVVVWAVDNLLAAALADLDAAVIDAARLLLLAVADAIRSPAGLIAPAGHRPRLCGLGRAPPLPA